MYFRTQVNISPKISNAYYSTNTPRLACSPMRLILVIQWFVRQYVDIIHEL